MKWEDWWRENSGNMPWKWQGDIILTKEAWEKGESEIKEKLEKVLKLTPLIEVKSCFDADSTRAIIYQAVQFIREKMKEN